MKQKLSSNRAELSVPSWCFPYHHHPLPCQGAGLSQPVREAPAQGGLAIREDPTNAPQRARRPLTVQLCSHPLAQRAQPQVLKDAEGRLPSPPPWEALLQQAEQVGGARGSQVCPGDPAGALRQQLRALQGEFEVLQLPGIQAPQVGQQLVTGTIMPRNAGRGSHRPGSEVSSRNRNSSCGNSGGQAPRLSPPSRSRIQPRAAFSAQHACLVFLCLLTSLFHKEGFPGGSAVKNPPPSAGDPGSIPESGRSVEEEAVTRPAFLREISWTEEPDGLTESETTEQLTLFFFPLFKAKILLYYYVSPTE